MFILTNYVVCLLHFLEWRLKGEKKKLDVYDESLLQRFKRELLERKGT